MTDRFVAITNCKTFHSAIYKKGRNSLFGPFWGQVFAGRDEYNNKVRMICTTDKMLGTINHPVSPFLGRGAFHATNVRTCTGFSHSQSIHTLTANSGHQISFNLLAFAGHKNILRATKEMIECHTSTAKFTFYQSKIHVT